jgi:hypothetical protein
VPQRGRHPLQHAAIGRLALAAEESRDSAHGVGHCSAMGVRRRAHLAVAPDWSARSPQRIPTRSSLPQSGVRR